MPPMRVLLLLLACDPALTVSEKQTRRSIEGCAEAVEHLRKCCPEYSSYLSCTVLETWTGQASSDLSPSESACLLKADCGAIEKAIVGEKSLCKITFRSSRCK
jgi:hypothetical protein